MKSFYSPLFVVNFPDDWKDASTYVVVGPEGTQFKPTFVINTQEVPEGITLQSYAIDQQTQLMDHFQDFQLLDQASVNIHGHEAIQILYEWTTEQSLRIRQNQVYILVGNTVYTLTATELASNFDNQEPIFDSIFRSFRPHT
jgi:hypothetical protein